MARPLTASTVVVPKRSADPEVIERVTGFVALPDWPPSLTLITTTG